MFEAKARAQGKIERLFFIFRCADYAFSALFLIWSLFLFNEQNTLWAVIVLVSSISAFFMAYFKVGERIARHFVLPERKAKEAS